MSLSKTSSPAKKHLTTQHKHDQDASERVWIRGVLGQTQASTASDVVIEDVNQNSNAHVEVDMKLELHMLLRNVGSRIRKSVTEGYTTPPTHTPNPSPSKDSANRNLNPATVPALQDQIFASSRDILYSVYSGPGSTDVSPRKRARAAIRLTGLEEDDSDEEKEEETEMDCSLSMTTRAIKPLPFRLSSSNKTPALVLHPTKTSATSTTTTSIAEGVKDEDPFSSPSTTTRNTEIEVMDINGLMRL